jgi:hypothetical protein
LAPVDVDVRHPSLGQTTGQQHRLAEVRPTVAVADLGFFRAEIKGLHGAGTGQHPVGSFEMLTVFPGRCGIEVALQVIECGPQRAAIRQAIRSQVWEEAKTGDIDFAASGTLHEERVERPAEPTRPDCAIGVGVIAMRQNRSRRQCDVRRKPLHRPLPGDDRPERRPLLVAQQVPLLGGIRLADASQRDCVVLVLQKRGANDGDLVGSLGQHWKHLTE